MAHKAEYFTDRTVGIGVCATALSAEKIIVCDLHRPSERLFLDEFEKHLDETNVPWKRLYDVADPYGYAWVYFDPRYVSEGDALKAARASFPQNSL